MNIVATPSPRGPPTPPLQGKEGGKKEKEGERTPPLSPPPPLRFPPLPETARPTGGVAAWACGERTGMIASRGEERKKWTKGKEKTRRKKETPFHSHQGPRSCEAKRPKCSWVGFPPSLPPSPPSLRHHSSPHSLLRRAVGRWFFEGGPVRSASPLGSFVRSYQAQTSSLSLYHIRLALACLPWLPYALPQPHTHTQRRKQASTHARMHVLSLLTGPWARRRARVWA